jgi:hypothetical protein
MVGRRAPIATNFCRFGERIGSYGEDNCERKAEKARIGTISHDFGPPKKSVPIPIDNIMDKILFHTMSLINQIFST